MPWCPKCGAEFRKGFTACNTCHVKLIAHKPDGTETIEELSPPPEGWERESPKKQRILRILRALTVVLLALAAALLLQNL